MKLNGYTIGWGRLYFWITKSQSDLQFVTIYLLSCLFCRNKIIQKYPSVISFVIYLCLLVFVSVALVFCSTCIYYFHGMSLRSFYFYLSCPKYLQHICCGAPYNSLRIYLMQFEHDLYTVCTIGLHLHKLVFQFITAKYIFPAGQPSTSNGSLILAPVASHHLLLLRL